MSHRWLWLVTAVLGAVMILMALLVGAIALVLAIGSPLTGATTGLLFTGGIIALGVCLGTALVAMGWSGWRQCPSRPFFLRLRWPVWVGLLLLIALGAVLAQAQGAVGLLLVPVHVVAMAAPAVIAVVLVAGWLRRSVSSGREVGVAFTSGSLIGGGFSLISEGVVGLVILLASAAILSRTSGGMEWLAVLREHISDPAFLSDPAQLAGLFLSPWVVVLVLAIVSIPVPLIEEAFKTIGIGLLGRRLRPGPATGFLWGAASGAGFALVENLLNGAAAAGSGWAPAVLARLAATVMHCFTGAIVGWGWTQLWVRRRPLVLFGSYLFAVVIHSLWNIVGGSAALLAIAAEVYAEDTVWADYASVGVVVLTAGMVGLCVVFLATIAIISRRLSTHPSRAAEPVPAAR